jgi:hypothetical protein
VGIDGEVGAGDELTPQKAQFLGSPEQFADEDIVDYVLLCVRGRYR